MYNFARRRILEHDLGEKEDGKKDLCSIPSDKIGNPEVL